MQTLLLLCRLEEAACLAIVPERLKGHAPADWKGRACLGADNRNRLGAGTPPCQEWSRQQGWAWGGVRVRHVGVGK
jgi:hypothetical protein